LRTFHDHWWRLKRFELSYGHERLMEGIDHLEASRPSDPYYWYAIDPSHRRDEMGRPGILADAGCQYALLNRHPLAPAEIDPLLMAELHEKARLVRRWRPDG
jgi:hypothetical protein